MPTKKTTTRRRKPAAKKAPARRTKKRSTTKKSDTSIRTWAMRAVFCLAAWGAFDLYGLAVENGLINGPTAPASGQSAPSPTLPAPAQSAVAGQSAATP